MTFTPKQLSTAIKKLIPNFEMHHMPDYREDIARTWPISIDDSGARRDWQWVPRYDLDVRHATVTFAV